MSDTRAAARSWCCFVDGWRGLAPGTVLEVVGCDPAGREDLSAWCRMTRNELVTMTGNLGQGEPIRYFIRTGREVFGVEKR